MLKHIKGRADKMELNTISLFNHLTDEDFLAIHNAGQLKNLCQALTLDLQHKKDTTYSA